jgi:acetyl esterase/lipase
MADPSKIVIAGDSAGEGLSLALLTLIREAGLPMPAGAVLISPWVDLTHLFPSVMNNSEMEIVPPYGFMHQPSVLWSPPSLKASISPAKPTPSASRSEAQPTPTTSEPQPSRSSEDINPFKLKLSAEQKIHNDESENSASIIELKDGQPVKMDQQILLYCTNDQLTHPYCYPLFSPSPGGLPPLMIIAGQNEIIYLAHRAAHPDQYPLRADLLNAHPERKTNAVEYLPGIAEPDS